MVNQSPLYFIVFVWKMLYNDLKNFVIERKRRSVDKYEDKINKRCEL